MVKKKASNKTNEANENIVSDGMVSSQAAMDPEPRILEKIVDVTINTIENIVRKDHVTLTLRVYHGETLLDESNPVRIEPDFREPPLSQPIDYLARYPITVTDRSAIDAAVSTPLLIQLIDHRASDATVRPVSSAAGDEKKKDKSKSGKKSAENPDPQLVGLCNVDLMPILLGEKTVTERLIVEKPDNVATSWMNLPLLTITLTQDDTDLFPTDSQVNYLGVTVESIYNLPASFADSLAYRAATTVYKDGADPVTVFFDGGKFSKYRDVEKTKRWCTLNGWEGRAGLSKYKIDCDYGSVKNPLEGINLKRVLEADKPRIEWNCLSRNVLLSPGQRTMRENINKYKHWPFQFTTTIDVSDSGKTKSREHKPQLYQCYADISELLYPGRTQARTIAQLHTYDSSEMLEKTGLDGILFTDGVPGDTKQKEKKGKLSAKGDSSVNSAIAEPEVAPGSPLTNEKGEPVFVIIQFELQQPLVPARTTEELTEELHELLGPPDRLPLYPYTGDTPEKQYSNCIRKLVETITESYRDFNEENASREESFNGNCSSRLGNFAASGNRYPYLPDEIDRFTQYLYDTGTYVAVRTTLKKRITRLLDQKFKMQSCTWDSEECQNFVADSYVYLVESMHAALNSESTDDRDDGPVSDADNLCSSAEENYELGNIPRAKRSYISLIATDRKNPDAWLRYAIFLKKIGDLDRAVECCREAISLNTRHKIALLLYGVVLAEKEDYRAAEIFLNTTTRTYPRFAEGWALLHLFYIRIEYYPGMDLTMRVAEQCLLDRDRDTLGMDFLEKEPLAWSTIHCPKDRMYLRMVVFLLKLNLLDFAGIALARELALAGRSTSWLYYMAVHHYLLGRFDDALSHLEEARHQHGMDYSISGLMGHCHFKEGNSQAARECYEYASTLFNRPADMRLIDLRLGSYCLNAAEYSRARKIFLSVCKISPSSSSWLGLGTACYNMMELKDAETALTEANRLDHTDPEVWAYLCLLNMRLHRHDEFAECYRQTVKNDLQNANLWLLVTNTMELLGFVSPMVLSTASDTIVTKTSEENNAEMEETRRSVPKSEHGL